MRAPLAIVIAALVAALPGLPERAAATGTAEAGGPRKQALAAHGAATHYHYENGQRRALRVDPGWIADFASPPRKSPGQAAAPMKRSIGGEKALAALPPGASPLLRDEHGAPRALPGGVIVRLRPADRASARERLAAAGLLPLRPLAPDGSAWLVDAPAGLAALDLANQLHESGRYESAAPNWWRPRALK